MTTTLSPTSPPATLRRGDRWTVRTLWRGYLVLLGVALFLLSRDAFFVADDFVNFVVARDQGLTLDYLLQPVFIHFAPGHRLLHLLLWEIGPDQGAVAHAILLLFVVASTALLRLVLRELYGDRGWTYAVAGLFGLAVPNVWVLLWVASAEHRLPAMAFGLLAILAHLRFRRTGRRWWVALAAVSIAVGLLFYVTVLLVPVLLLLVDVLVLDDRRPVLAGLRQAWRSWWVWLAYALPPLAFLATFLLRYHESTGLGVDVGRVTEATAIGWFYVAGPAAVGQRLPEMGFGATQGIAAVGVVVLAQVLLAALLLVSLLRRPSSWRAWAVLAVVSTIGALMAYTQHVPVVGPGVAFDLRYHSEVTYLLAILAPLGLARPATSRTWAGTGVARRHLRVAATLAVVAVATSTLVTDVRLSRTWEGRTAQAWVGNLDRSLRAIAEDREDVAIVDAMVPEEVSPPYFEEWSTVGTIAPLYHPEVAVRPNGRTLLGATADGTVAPVTLDGGVSVAGPDLLGNQLASIVAERVVTEDDALCLGGESAPATVNVLAGEVPADGPRHVQLSLAPLPAATDLHWRVAPRDRPLEELPEVHALDPGDTTVMLPLDVPASWQFELGVPPGQELCIEQLAVGRLVPLSATG